jgi:hypothetical protein
MSKYIRRRSYDILKKKQLYKAERTKGIQCRISLFYDCCRAWKVGPTLQSVQLAATKRYATQQPGACIPIRSPA